MEKAPRLPALGQQTVAQLFVTSLNWILQCGFTTPLSTTSFLRIRPLATQNIPIRLLREDLQLRLLLAFHHLSPGCIWCPPRATQSAQLIQGCCLITGATPPHHNAFLSFYITQWTDSLVQSLTAFGVSVAQWLWFSYDFLLFSCSTIAEPQNLLYSSGKTCCFGKLFNPPDML